MNVLAAVKTISFAADVARTLELQKHLRSLVGLIRARKQKGKPKSELDLLDEEIQVIGETVAILVEQMKTLEHIQLRLAAFEEWSSLPWWKRMFSKPRAVTVVSSVPALQSSNS
ncbi:MAG: hypothetical protein H7Y17_02435 [Chlorobia bacterium]|nr:hypothetical protein [Fimbriimonadaceae bacterium]